MGCKKILNSEIKKSLCYIRTIHDLGGNKMEKLADIGVFGGSGFYSFLEDIEKLKLKHLMACLVTVYLSVKLVLTK